MKVVVEIADLWRVEIPHLLLLQFLEFINKVNSVFYLSSLGFE